MQNGKSLFQQIFVVYETSLVNILAKNPYFFPTTQILEPLFLFVFSFRKICNRQYQCHHFHLGFC